MNPETLALAFKATQSACECYTQALAAFAKYDRLRVDSIAQANEELDRGRIYSAEAARLRREGERLFALAQPKVSAHPFPV